MKDFNLSYYCAAAMEIPCLSQGLSLFREAGGRVRVHARTSTQLFDQSRVDEFVAQSLKADIIILTLHGGRESCPAFEPLVTALEALPEDERPWLHIQPVGGDEDAVAAAESHSSRFGSPDWDRIYQYIHHGGTPNFLQLFHYISHALTGQGPEALEPVPVPDQGLYHPDMPGIPTREEYRAARIKPDRLTVGLWFNQSYWVNHNLAHLDDLIRRIEAAGHNVITVFHLRYRDGSRENKGADYVVEKYFMEKGKPAIDVLINPMMFSLTLVHDDYKDLYSRLNVPVIQAITTLQPRENWEASIQGLTTMEVSFSASQPEFDGTLISVPTASREEEKTDPLTGALVIEYQPIEERSQHVVNLALNWARLSRVSHENKKVAVIFHHYPPRNDRIGCAAGLDSFQSVKHLVDEMKELGYTVDKTYETGDELAHEIVSGMTYDQRWLLPEQMAEKAEATAGADHYRAWHGKLPASNREKQVKDWGELPGDLFVHQARMLFPGVHNGNLFITVQPPRGYLENVDQIYHDMYLSPPHVYQAHYRYIKEIFRADAVIHVGKHGSLEWLPGKALGLSRECWPDTAIMDLPNIYPYIINDPSEGTQAKRRSCACIVDHLTPVFTNADLYEDLSELENHLAAYQDAVNEDPGKVAVLKPMIWEAVAAAHLDHDLSITEEKALADFPAFLERLHHYLSDLSDTMINDGLHVLGQVPEGDRLTEFLVQLVRVDNGSIPSLRESIVSALGYDYDDLVSNKGQMARDGKTSKGKIIEQAHDLALNMVGELLPRIPPEMGEDDMAEQIRAVTADHFPHTASGVVQSLEYLFGSVVANIRKTPEEIQACINALDGGFVPPGPSGAPTRGQAGILPTGRNFYSVDPNKIPSPGAWEVGKRLGDALLEKYLDETGEYPRSVGIIVFGGPTMRSKGDDIAEIFYLLGLKPVWHPVNQRITGFTVIPMEELGRPRIDVLPRISGFFRDCFPLLVERIDDAVRMVAALDEPLESNMIRRHVLRDAASYETAGADKDTAFDEACFRVFGCPPGTYGAGVSELVEAKNWETKEDLGKNYIRYSSHAYGRGSYGNQKPEAFKKLLNRMDVTVKNEDSREYDMMSCTDYYNYYGGLIAAGTTVRGTAPMSLMGDSSDPKRVQLRTTAEEARHVLRSRLTNPKWLEGMMRHGYKGAGDISKMMDVALGWDATADVMEDWMYQKMTQAYILDEKMKEWMNLVNPHARQNILDKLLEAVSRGMWQADEEMKDQLMEEYLEMEGRIEGLNE